MAERKASNGTFWTEKEIAYLKENYYIVSAITEIATALKRSPSSVRVKAQRLGLKKRESRHWTQEELDYLEDQWGAFTYESIAKKLNRTPEAVRVKAIHLGYPSYQLSQDGITLIELSQALKVDYNKIQRWVANLSLPTYSIKISSKQKKKLIALDKFWKWAKANKELIDFSRMERNILGAEPSWVVEQRKQDFYNLQKRIKHSCWTKDEERQLKYLVNEFKYTYSEIADRLNRSEKMIAQKLVDLNIKARPIRAESKKWTAEETIALLKMVEEGSSKSELVKRFRRSETAILGKLRKIKSGREKWPPDYQQTKELMLRG